MRAIRTALFMNSLLFREACAFYLGTERDIRLMLTAPSTNSALRLLPKTCDVAVVEIDVSTGQQFESIRRLRKERRRTRMVLFSATASDLLIRRGAKLGMRGYLTPEVRLNELANGIRRVDAGGFCFSRKVKSRLVVDTAANCLRVKPEVQMPDLTDTQLEVLRLVAIGHTTQEIAELTGRTEKSIECVKYRVMNKLGLRDRVSLSRYAIREGIIRA